MAGELTSFWLSRGRGVVGPDPDGWESQPSAKFGEKVTTATAIFDGFKLESDAVEAYWDGSWFRSVVKPGAVMPGDPSTTERSEAWTLGIIKPLVSSSPTLGMSFDLWIPSAGYTPAGGSNLVLAQIKLSGGDATQLLIHANGNLRLRTWNGTAYVYFNLLSPGNFRGKWLRIDFDGVHSKSTAGQLRVRIDGATVLSRLDQANIPAAVSDASKVYLKLGVYRTSVDTDPDRGIASMWYRNVQTRQTFS